MNTWVPIVWMAISLVTLVPVTRWLARRITRLTLLLTGNPTVAVYVWFCLLFPGILVHELSHWLAATLLGVKVFRVSFGPQPQGQGQVQFGAVAFRRADFLRESIIGLAPLIIGTALALFIVHVPLCLPLRAPILMSDLFAQLRQVFYVQDAWLWLYLLIAISNAMLPSASDRQAWPALLLFLTFVGALLALAGAADNISSVAIARSAASAISLALVFTLSILLDLLIGSCLWMLETALEVLLGREVIAGEGKREV